MEAWAMTGLARNFANMLAGAARTFSSPTGTPPPA